MPRLLTENVSLEFFQIILPCSCVKSQEYYCIARRTIKSEINISDTPDRRNSDPKPPDPIRICRLHSVPFRISVYGKHWLLVILQTPPRLGSFCRFGVLHRGRVQRLCGEHLGRLVSEIHGIQWTPIKFVQIEPLDIAVSIGQNLIPLLMLPC